MSNVGIYYYPWYNAERWKQHRINFTPSIGLYNSSSSEVINYHAELMKYMDIDFVIIEIVPIIDWSYQFVIDSGVHFANALRDNNIKFSFLIDTATGEGWPNTANDVDKILKKFRDIGVEPTFTRNTKPIYFNYNPPLEDSYDFQKLFINYDVYFLRYLYKWDVSLSDINRWINQKCLRKINFELFSERSGYKIDTSRSIHNIYEFANFTPFWCATEVMTPMNKFISVIPGYDDLLLERDPQIAPVVPRKNGQTLVEQFAIANALGADDILLYGFNEFFEGTNIEPTLEYGDFYVELTKELVRQTHNGEQIHYPEWLKSEKGKIVYLSQEIERTAQRHADKIPRWDADWWQATLENLCPPLVREHEICFERVRITNSGIKAWPIASKNAPIRLGARLYDKEGNVLSEGRSELGDTDILPDTAFEQGVSVEIPSQVSPATVSLGIVWEDRFWFTQELQYTLS